MGAVVTKRDLGLLRHAALVAMNSTLRVRVGAITEAYFKGWNRKHTHPKLVEWGYEEHSDIHAEADLALNGYEAICGRMIYVARLTRDGEWALAKPCEACMALLAHAEVKGVVWTTGPGTGEGVRL